MVMSKLHIICGNCGCNNDFELHIIRQGNAFLQENGETEFEDSAYISCKNCGTLHDIKNNVKKVVATRES